MAAEHGYITSLKDHKIDALKLCLLLGTVNSRFAVPPLAIAQICTLFSEKKIKRPIPSRRIPLCHNGVGAFQAEAGANSEGPSYAGSASCCTAEALVNPVLESSLELAVDAVWGNQHSPRDVPWAGLQIAAMPEKLLS